MGTALHGSLTRLPLQGGLTPRPGREGKPVSRRAPVHLLIALVCAAARPLPALGATAPLAMPPLFDARAVAMGGAAVATASGVSSMPHNPAGLAAPRLEVAFGAAVGSPDPSVRATDLFKEVLRSFDDPRGPSTPGQAAAWTAVALQGSAAAFSAWAEVEPDRPQAGSETRAILVSAAAFGTARSFVGFRARGSVSVGSAVRLIHVRRIGRSQPPAAGGDPAAPGQVGRGFAVDLGLLARPSGWLTVGVALRDVAGSLRWDANGSNSAVPGQEWLWSDEGWAAGVAIGDAGSAGVFAAELRPRGGWSLGLEQRLFGGLLAVRVGRERSSDGEIAHGFGIGLGLGPFRADAALRLPLGAPAVAGVASVALRL